jgi:AraC family transcriptional regulator
MTLSAGLPPAAPDTSRLFIGNMVCPQCSRVVQRRLEELGLQVELVTLGAADVLTPPGGELPLAAVRAALEEAGFALVEDPARQLVEQTKTLVLELVRYTSPAELTHNFSYYLSQRLQRDYHYLSQLFSAHEGLTLEKYIIRQKVEWAKELLSYQDVSVADVAQQLGYSSAAYLTNQFKQVTGLSPSEFQRLGPGSAGRRSLDDLI